ncbi:MAG: ABC transporter substrate-binding protein [Acidimicrobiales bacterium]
MRVRLGIGATLVVASMMAGLVAPGSAAAAKAPASAPATALVRLPFPKDDGSLTPYTFDLGYSLMTLVYDTLDWRNLDGVPELWLATSVVTSPNGRRLTVHLAKGVRWQDGMPLTAADVAFTFGYFAAHHQARFTPEVADVSRTRATGPTTVVIDLRHPSPGFAQLTLADMPILPEHLWAHLAPGQTTPPGLAMGSGPYRLVAYQPGKGYRFQANPDYFRGPPSVSTIEVPIIHDLAGTLSAFEHSQVDMVPLSLPQNDVSPADDLT